jgi:hypothetical protein
VVRHIQEVIRALKKGKGKTDPSIFRMADFAEFCLTFARYADISNRMNRIFEKLSTEQTYFTLEDDTIFELLTSWLELPENNGREVTATELCNELKDLAFEKRIEFPYENQVQAFGQRLNSIWDNLAEVFKVSKRKGRSRRTLYKFSLEDNQIPEF